LEVSSLRLLAFDGFEQRFEIPIADALRAFALNDLEKERWAILYWLRENLEQITFIIAIHENPELLERIQLFVDVTDPIEQRLVISRRHFQELEPALLQRGNRLHDVVGSHCDVLTSLHIVII